MNNVSLGDLKHLVVYLPSFAEQKRIVAKVDELMALCDAIERKLEKSEEESGKLLEAVVRGVVSG